MTKKEKVCKKKSLHLENWFGGGVGVREHCWVGGPPQLVGERAAEEQDQASKLFSVLGPPGELA